MFLVFLHQINVGTEWRKHLCLRPLRSGPCLYIRRPPPVIPVGLSERAEPHGVLLSRQHLGVGVRFGLQLEVPTAVVRFSVSGCSCWGTTSISVLKDLCDT